MIDPPGDDEVRRLFDCAYRSAFRLLGRRDDAQDIAQEAVARALARWSVVGSYADAWSTRVAINLAIGSRRRRRPSSLGGQPEVREPQSDLRIDLVLALRSLSKRQREAVALRYLADLSQDQVAEAMGCSVGAVSQHTSRGLARLREELGPDREEHLHVRTP